MEETGATIWYWKCCLWWRCG